MDVRLQRGQKVLSTLYNTALFAIYSLKKEEEEERKGN